MDQIEFEAVVITLIDELKKRGSWSGITHLQKTLFFLQDMMKIPLGHDFVLYKHGPYSFDLQPAVNAMLANQILNYEIREPDFGASFVRGDNCKVVFTRETESLIEQCRPRIEFVAEKLANKNVSQLERIATAFLVYDREGLDDDEAVAWRINQLKPHVSIEKAKEAIIEAKKILTEAQLLIRDECLVS